MWAEEGAEITICVTPAETPGGWECGEGTGARLPCACSMEQENPGGERLAQAV